MYLFDRIAFLIGETFASLRRNALMSLAAISTATVALVLLGGFSLTAFGVGRLADKLPDKFLMRVVLKNEATTEQIDSLEKQIKGFDHVYGVSHQSKEQNWKEVQAKYKDVAGDLSDIQNPMPDTFTFKTEDLQSSPHIAQTLRALPFVERVQYLEEDQKAVLKMTQMMRVAGIALNAALMFAAMTLIYNALRITIYSRRREIRVMQLVGASAHTIRTPFLLEAILQGALGGAIAAGLVWVGTQPAINALSQVDLLHGVLQPADLRFAVVMLPLCGALLGSFCGLAAIRKFLRV